jgi:nicotinamide-nucleotide amidase
MIGAILSIGDELTLGQTLDTNSQWLSSTLADHGVLVNEHRTLGDDRAGIAAAIRELVNEHGILVITGGLGPTEDDLTRDALGDVATPGEPLIEDSQALDEIKRWFSRRTAGMPPSNLRQALRPRTMRCLPNANGTAPGLAGDLAQCQLFS